VQFKVNPPKVFGVLIILLLTFSSTSAQRQHVKRTRPAALPCALTLEQSPQFRGIRLGDNLSTLISKFPKLAAKYKEAYRDGSIAPPVFLTADEDSGNPAFEGVKLIVLGFLDERVASVRVEYDENDFKPRSIDDFTSQVAKQFGLPNSWKPAYPSRQITCKGFEVTVGYGGELNLAPSVALIYTALEKEIERRTTEIERREAERQQMEEKKRRTYRP